MPDRIQVGYQAFLIAGGEEFGAVREVKDDAIVVYVENAGDFRVPLDAVAAVHSQKVVFAPDKLDPKLVQAIEHAHDAEQRGL